MKSASSLFALLLVLATGCGGADTADQAGTSPQADMATEAAAAMASDVPDPCALVTVDEAATLGGPVEAGAEDEVAVPGIRRCTWDGNNAGYYGMTVIVNTGGFAAARQMIIGTELTIDDLGMPAYFEMIEDGVSGIGVEKNGTAIQLAPVWTSRPAATSEAAAALKQVARSAAGRL